MLLQCGYYHSNPPVIAYSGLHQAINSTKILFLLPTASLFPTFCISELLVQSHFPCRQWVMFFQAPPSWFLCSLWHLPLLAAQKFTSSHSSLFPFCLCPRTAIPHAQGDRLGSLLEELPSLTLETATSPWALPLAEGSGLPAGCSSPSSCQSPHLGTEKRGFVESCVGASCREWSCPLWPLAKHQRHLNWGVSKGPRMLLVPS